MSIAVSNPLSKHFRQPAIYLKLPSGGAYWPENAIDLPLTGEIPVFPMTVRDEITLRTPDALLNGEGMVQVIQSCCPNIKDAWSIPSVDVDAILVGIRIASYGSDMEVKSTCSHCNSENHNTIDLNQIMDRFRMPNFNNLVNTNNLKIKLKPQLYLSVNKNNLVMFEEQRILQTITNESLSEEERTRQFNAHMSRLLDLNVELLANSTEYIETSDGQKVTNIEYIKEFYANSDSGAVKKIRESLEKISKDAALPPITIACESCEKTYEMNITFDYSSFFDQGS